jgi:hypothetical protein
VSNLKFEIFTNLRFACRQPAILQNKGKSVIIADLRTNYQPQPRVSFTSAVFSKLEGQKPARQQGRTGRRLTTNFRYENREKDTLEKTLK